MKKSTIYTIIGVLFVAAAVFFGFLVVRTTYSPRAVESEAYAPVATEAPTPEPTAPPAASTDEPADTPEPTATPYVSAVDFEALQAINSDIYGWLELEGAEISHPILQSATDDTYYLTHNSDGDYSAGGSIFSEHEFNAKDFSDPVTILYGHHTMTGAIFSDLQEYYSDEEFFNDNPIIKVYTPEGLLEYGVFAAVPYSDEHILYYNDFTDEEDFNYFFTGISNTRDLSAHLNEEYWPSFGDHVLILSTCRNGTTSRFLVMGTLLP